MTISEDDDLEEAAANGADFDAPKLATSGDSEVAAWVASAMKLRSDLLEQGIAGPIKPALHAAPLTTVASPGLAAELTVKDLKIT